MPESLGQRGAYTASSPQWKVWPLLPQFLPASFLQQQRRSSNFKNGRADYFLKTTALEATRCVGTWEHYLVESQRAKTC